MKSVGAMLKQLTAMLGTDDLNGWETGFVESVMLQSKDGAATANLSESQVDKITQIYSKHFGDAE